MYCICAEVMVTWGTTWILISNLNRRHVVVCFIGLNSQQRFKYFKCSFWNVWCLKKGATPSCKNIMFLWASAIRVCHPLWGYAIPVTEEVLAMSGLGVEVAQMHDGASALPRSPTCVCQPVAFRSPGQMGPSGARSVRHCRYWTTYKCCGLTRSKNKRELVFLFLISEWQRGRAHIYREWNDPWKMADLSIKSGQRQVNEKKNRLFWSVSNPRRNFFLGVFHSLFLDLRFFSSFFTHIF